MNKELRPGHEEIVCDVCGRTMLKGERAEPYLVGGGQRMLVCELCTDRAYAAGWIRESAHDELPRTIAGIARSLGEPWVSATPDTNLPSEVSVVVAWELSWYHFRVDLGDEHDPVTLAGKGEELDELADWAREWNASADADGRLALGVRSGQ